MADNPTDRFYTKDHEWAQTDSAEANVVTIGITGHAQESLGDIVMVELPEVGDSVELGKPVGTVESPKSVSDIFSPIGGEVVAINEELLDAPELINDDPYGAGWILRIETDNAAALQGLMDNQAYEAFVHDETGD